MADWYERFGEQICMGDSVSALEHLPTEAPKSLEPATHL